MSSGTRSPNARRAVVRAPRAFTSLAQISAPTLPRARSASAALPPPSKEESARSVPTCASPALRSRSCRPANRSRSEDPLSGPPIWPKRWSLAREKRGRHRHALRVAAADAVNMRRLDAATREDRRALQLSMGRVTGPVETAAMHDHRIERVGKDNRRIQGLGLPGTLAQDRPFSRHRQLRDQPGQELPIVKTPDTPATIATRFDRAFVGRPTHWADCPSPRRCATQARVSRHRFRPSARRPARRKSATQLPQAPFLRRQRRQMIGMPFNASTPIMYYNTAAPEAAGVPRRRPGRRSGPRPPRPSSMPATSRCPGRTCPRSSPRPSSHATTCEFVCADCCSQWFSAWLQISLICIRSVYRRAGRNLVGNTHALRSHWPQGHFGPKTQSDSGCVINPSHAASFANLCSVV